jgi:hypothetical protein
MIRPAIPIVLGMLAMSGTAHAHKLELAYHFQPGWRVQVQSWYEGGDPASGACVKIVQVEGQVLSEGRLDKYGIYNFSFSEVKELKIIVSVTGHRAEETIPAEALNRHLVSLSAACMTSQPFQTAALLQVQASAVETTGHVDLSDNPPASFPFAGVLIGVGALLIVAIAFKWLSMRKPA